VSQTKAELIKGLNINASAPATALQIDASGNVNIDSNTLYVDATNNRVGLGTSSPTGLLTVASASPVIDWTNSSNTAFKHSIESTNYSSTAANNTFAFKVASGSGTQATVMTLNGAGQVGIGTATPSATLDVIASGSAGTETQIARLISGTTTGLIVYSTPVGTGDTKVGLYAESGSSFSQSSALAFETRTSGTRTEKARIDSSGRLLVGTSSSRTVAGNTSQIQLEGTSYQSISLTSNVNDTSGAYVFLSKSRGTANGSNTVVQSGDTLGGVYFIGAGGSDTHYGGAIQCQVDGTPGANDMPGRLVFSTTADGASSPTERMRIGSDGLVTIYNGNTTFLRLNNSGGYDGLHQVDNNAYTIGQNSAFRALRIGSGNNWLTTGVNLASGGTSWGTYSDERLKEDIVELNGCLEQLSGIRCVTYRLKDIDDSDSKKRLGVIAQDLEGKFDEALNASRRSEDDENEYLSVQYSDLVPVLIKSLQEAKERIETLEAKVSALEGA